MQIQFEKKINKLGVISIALGAIIGWGAFVLPGNFFIKEIGVLNTMIGLFLGAIIMCIIEKNYGFLLSKYPEAGGEFIYTYIGLGKKNAFICGWVLILSYISIVQANGTAVSVVLKNVIASLQTGKILYKIQENNIYLHEVLIGIGILIFLGVLNIIGINLVSKFQTYMTLSLVAIVIYIFLYIVLNPEVSKLVLISHFNLEKIELSKILKVLAIAPWAYIGFDTIPQAVEEFNFPGNQASKLAMIAIFLGFLIYNMLNVITATIFTEIDLSNPNILWATGEAVERVMGKNGIYILSLGILLAIIAGINGFYMAASRLIYSMAKEKCLPKILNRLNRKTKTPKNAILLVIFISLIAPLFGREALLCIVDTSSLGASIGYLYTSLVALKIAKKESKRKNLIYGLCGSLLGIFFIITLVVPIFPGSLSKASYIVMFIWIILGYIVYKIGGEND